MRTMARDANIPSTFARSVALLLSALLAAGPLAVPTYGQTMQPAAAAGTHQLFITILDGEGALNNIRQRDAREPVVQVTDENHKPVAGVALLFLIHGGDAGGTATFGDTATSLGTSTNARGIARAPGLQTGHSPGSFTIGVTATLGALVVTAIIHESNIIGALNTSTENSAQGSGGAGAGSGAVHHGIFHVGKTAMVTAGVVAAAVGIAAFIYATSGTNATTLTLGASTVSHP